eukprot:CAMPEP_0117479578 /NCGR_PEP_ID=MMETSP0784-20121206/11956_1 /TAXON_ID=39447 /ORGANISM="" /LENGTH=540 /DNA_ID=CAMNT_0005274007 /DNA_START=774 /DNA_END=2394 /DNA_ORIENTATION=+
MALPGAQSAGRGAPRSAVVVGEAFGSPTGPLLSDDAKWRTVTGRLSALVACQSSEKPNRPIAMGELAAVIALLAPARALRSRVGGARGSRQLRRVPSAKSNRGRRMALAVLGAAMEPDEGATVDWRIPKATRPAERWPFWPVLPIAPYDRRRTLRHELVPGELWGFDQKQGVYYVHVPIRMTVYRFRTRPGLLVYAPVAPTDECVALLRELEAEHGAVAYIVLPTCAVEHKYFVGPFARCFPEAEVWVCPGQFSVPLPLPLAFLGFPTNRLHVLPRDPQEPSVPEDWRREGLDFRILGPIGKDLATGAFAEVVFYLRPLKTMLVTDLVVSVPSEPPGIVMEDPRALAFHARDGPTEPVDTSPEAMACGWRRICIFALMFRTTAIEVQGVPEAVRDALESKAPELGWSGFLPCNYREQWEETFQAISGEDGGLLVPPILSELVLNRYLSTDVWAFVEATATAWADMQMVVPAHFAAPVAAGTREWRDAFRRAFGEPPAEFQEGWRLPMPFGIGAPPQGPQPLEADLAGLRGVSEGLTRLGV